MYTPSPRTAKNDFNDVMSGANDLQGNSAENALNRTGRQIRNFFDSATSEVTHAKETVTNQIKERPIQSSLTALGVGMVLGLLLRR